MNNCLHLNQQMFRCFLFCLLVFTVLLVFGLIGVSWMCRLIKFHLDTFNILVVQSLQSCLKGDTAFFCHFPLNRFQNTLATKCITECKYHSTSLLYQSLTLIPSLPTQRHLKNPDPTQSSHPRLKKLLSLSLIACPSLALPFILLLKYCSFYSHKLCTSCHGF